MTYTSDWKPGEVERLRALREAGFTAKQIAERLPGRTVVAVNKQCIRMALPSYRYTDRAEVSPADARNFCDRLLARLFMHHSDRLQSDHPERVPRYVVEGLVKALTAPPPEPDPEPELKPEPKPEPRPDPYAGIPHGRRILREMMAKHNLPRHEMMGRSRVTDIVIVRQETMYRMWVEANLSLNQIGNIFDKDHTTVLYAIRRHAERNGLPVPDTSQGMYRSMG